MRRAPVVSDENASAIQKLQDEFSGLKRSVDGVLALEGDVRILQSQMASIRTWKDSTATPAFQRLEASSEASVKSSQFDRWVNEHFVPVREQCSSFDEYLRAQGCSHIPAPAPPGTPGNIDTDMTVAHMTGAKRPGEQQFASPAATAKRRHTPSTGPTGSANSAILVDQPDVSASSSSTSSNQPVNRELDFWAQLPPTVNNQWTDDALDCLLAEWDEEQDRRLMTWVQNHAGGEWPDTVNAVKARPMGPEKRDGIKAILSATRTPLRVFTNIPPRQQ